MPTDSKLHDEQGRLSALRRYEVLDTARESGFERITALIQTVLNVPMATVSLIDANRQWYKSCVGMDSADLPRHESFCTHTIQSREPLVIPDTLLDARVAQYPSVTGEPHVRSYVGIPLSSPDGYNLGSLCALDKQPRDFSPAQIEVMKSFAALVVDELELRRIAQTDSLTGAATRRGFLLECEKAIAQHRRHATPAVLLLLDIDHFKRVNDTFGHPAGDLVLQGVSQAILSTLRKEDSFGRLGGEEFGILLNATLPETALATAERLRKQIGTLRFGPDGPAQVTASFGVSRIDGFGTPAEWMAHADAALYDSKRSGRNRCTVAGDAVEELASVA